MSKSEGDIAVSAYKIFFRIFLLRAGSGDEAVFGLPETGLAIIPG